MPPRDERIRELKEKLRKIRENPKNKMVRVEPVYDDDFYRIAELLDKEDEEEDE